MAGSIGQSGSAELLVVPGCHAEGQAARLLCEGSHQCMHCIQLIVNEDVVLYEDQSDVIFFQG